MEGDTVGVLSARSCCAKGEATALSQTLSLTIGDEREAGIASAFLASSL